MIRGRIAALVFTLAFWSSLHADLTEKRDTAIDMNAAVGSIAVFRNLLYASTGAGRIYRWNSQTREWDQLPSPEQSDTTFGHKMIQLHALHDHLIAISGEWQAARIYEWSGQYWKQFGYMAVEGVDDAFTTPDGSLYSVSSNSLLKLDSAGDWKRIWRDGEGDFAVDPIAIGFISTKPTAVKCGLNTTTCEVIDVLTKSTARLDLGEARVGAVASVSTSLYLSLYRIIHDRPNESRPEWLNRIARWDGKSLSFLATNLPVLSIFTLDETLYINTRDGLLRLDRDHWTPTGLHSAIEMTRFDGKLVAATSDGVFEEGSPEKWQPLGAIEATVNDISTRGKERLYATDRDVYSTVFGKLHVPIMQDYFLGSDQEKPPEASYKSCTRVVSVASGTFAICRGQLWRQPVRGMWAQVLFRHGESVDDLFGTSDQVYVSTNSAIYKESEGKFSSLGQLGQHANAVAVVNDRVFAGTDNGPFVYDAIGNAWKPLPTLMNVKVTAFSNASPGTKYIYLGTRQGEIWKIDGVTSTATHLSDKFQSSADPSILSIWYRRGAPQPSHDAVIVGTKDALFWSNDGGDHWNRATKLTKINHILDLGGHELAVAALEGPYTIAERIPSEWWPLIRNTITSFAGKWWWAGALLLAIALFFPTTLTLRLIQVMPDGVKNAYFLSLFIAPIARRRLLARYTSYLRRSRVVPTLGGVITLKEAVARYVSLPYKPDIGQATPAAILHLMDDSDLIWVRGGAGLGKSLLLWQIAWLLLANRKVPIVLDGYSWHGEIGDQITAALRRGGAPVTQKIVDELLEAGAFSILIDGFSEIRMPYRDTAAEKLNDFRANRSLIVASRLPPPDGSLAASATEVELLPLDSHDALIPFLKKYLRNNEIKATTLRDAIEKQLRLTPEQWTPLMLAMIAATYEATGDVPDNRSHAYRQYFDRLVRREAIGDLSPASVKFALERLTRDTFLQFDGDRGFAETKALTVFSELLDELKKRYGVDVNASRMLETIEGSGILVRSSSRRLRYFHDSFESFVAARYLQDLLAQKEFEEIRAVAAKRDSNIGLRETWSFLTDLVEERRDLETLAEIERSASAAA